MNKNELTFEIEVMAFQVAIFLSHVANHLKEILPKCEATWHIDANALYQGLRYFKQYVEKVWHVLYIAKESCGYAIPAFRSVDMAERAGFVLKFSNAASIGDARYISVTRSGPLLDYPSLR